MRRRILCIALCSIVGCATPDAEQNETAAHDSAGVEIVDNPGHDWAGLERWRVSPTPVLEIGQREGEDPYLLSHVGAVFRLQDGRIVIVNGQTAEFRFYDAQGTHLYSTGGRGGGPGKLRELYNVTLLPGDTLVALDLATGDLDYFDSNGQFVQRSRLSLHTVYERPYTVSEFTVLRDKTLLLVVYLDEYGPPGERYRRPGHMVRWNPLRFTLDTLAPYRGWTTFRVDAGAPEPIAWMTPFHRSTTHAVSPRYLYVGDNEAYQVRVYAWDGSLVRVIGRQWRPTQPTEAHHERFRTWFHERMERAPPPYRGGMERWLAQVPYEDTFPAFYRLWVDADERLWVLESPAGDSTRTWSVFSSQGHLLAAIELPAGFFPWYGHGDTLLGLWRDELGVEFVRQYRVIRDSGAN